MIFIFIFVIHIFVFFRLFALDLIRVLPLTEMFSLCIYEQLSFFAIYLLLN